jgi:hypothetical protein
MKKMVAREKRLARYQLQKWFNELAVYKTELSVFSAVTVGPYGVHQTMSGPPSGSSTNGASSSKDVEEYRHDSWYPYLRIVEFDSVISALPLFGSIALDVVLSITVLLAIYGPDPGKVGSLSVGYQFWSKCCIFVIIMCILTRQTQTLQIFEGELAPYSAGHAIADVAVANILKAAVICAYCCFGILKRPVLVILLAALVLACIKLALFRGWSEHSGAVTAALLCTAATTLLQTAAVYKTRYAALS